MVTGGGGSGTHLLPDFVLHGLEQAGLVAVHDLVGTQLGLRAVAVLGEHVVDGGQQVSAPVLAVRVRQLQQQSASRK